MPDAEASSFSRTTFTVTPPTYGGLSVTFAEGAETLRGNEAVRDGVIDRECPVGAPGDLQGPRPGGGGRHGTGTPKRPVPASCAASWRPRPAAHPGARMVLVTAGWPARDASRVGLNRALGQLRTLGTSLVVDPTCRAPGAVPRAGARRQRAPWPRSCRAQFVPLGVESDLERARGAVGAACSPPAGRRPAPVEAGPS